MARGRKRIALALSLACSPVLAQQASAPATTTPAPSNAADSNSLDRPKAAELFRESGSLFDAGMAAQGVESSRVKASAVSFFAVPKPEPRVLKKHDLVTIIIREESEVSADGNTDLKKEAALQATIEEWVRLNFQDLSKLAGSNENLPSIRMNGNREFKGEAKVDRTDSFIGRIQAEVVDVKPNGTFVVQARKRIKFDEEEQEFVLSGVCRAADVTPDNTVLSTQVYNLELEKKHKGQVRNTTKKGLVPRLVDFINPF
jgi:flagellar L-ring protein precursor FlgH